MAHMASENVTVALPATTTAPVALRLRQRVEQDRDHRVQAQQARPARRTVFGHRRAWSQSERRAGFLERVSMFQRPQ